MALLMKNIKTIPKFKTNSWVKYQGRIYIVSNIEIVGKEIYYDIYFNTEKLKSIPENKLLRRT